MYRSVTPSCCMWTQSGGRSNWGSERRKAMESRRCFLGKLCKQKGARWQVAVWDIMCIAYSSLTLGCVLLAPRSNLNTLVAKDGTGRRPGLKARLMGQRSRSVCCVSGCQHGSFGVPKVSWGLHSGLLACNCQLLMPQPYFS